MTQLYGTGEFASTQESTVVTMAATLSGMTATTSAGTDISVSASATMSGMTAGLVTFDSTIGSIYIEIV